MSNEKLQEGSIVINAAFTAEPLSGNRQGLSAFLGVDLRAGDGDGWRSPGVDRRRLRAASRSPARWRARRGRRRSRAASRNLARWRARRGRRRSRRGVRGPSSPRCAATSWPPSRGVSITARPAARGGHRAPCVGAHVGQLELCATRAPMPAVARGSIGPGASRASGNGPGRFGRVSEVRPPAPGAPERPAGGSQPAWDSGLHIPARAHDRVAPAGRQQVARGRADRAIRAPP